jgi:hypothetical protein
MRMFSIFIILASFGAAPVWGAEPTCPPKAAGILAQVARQLRERTEVDVDLAWSRQNNARGARRFRFPPRHRFANNAGEMRREQARVYSRLKRARDAALDFRRRNPRTPLPAEIKEEILAASSELLMRTGVPNEIITLNNGTRVIQVLPDRALGADTSFLTRLAIRLADRDFVQRGVSTHRAPHPAPYAARLYFSAENIVFNRAQAGDRSITLGAEDLMPNRRASRIATHELRHFHEASRRIVLHRGTSRAPLISGQNQSAPYNSAFTFDEAEAYFITGSSSYNFARQMVPRWRGHLDRLSQPVQIELRDKIAAATSNYSRSRDFIERAREAIRPLIQNGRISIQGVNEQGLLEVELPNGNFLTFAPDTYAHLGRPPYSDRQLTRIVLRVLSARDQELAQLQTRVNSRLQQLSDWAQVMGTVPP